MLCVRGVEALNLCAQLRVSREQQMVAESRRCIAAEGLQGNLHPCFAEDDHLRATGAPPDGGSLNSHAEQLRLLKGKDAC